MEVAHQSYASINSACEQFHTEHSEDPVFVESFEAGNIAPSELLSITPCDWGMAAEEIANNVKDLHEHLDGLYKAVDGKCLPQLLTPDQLPLA